jgi:hypothetical protein
MDDWGEQGPVFGPYDWAHTTYGSNLKLGKDSDNLDDLPVSGDGLIYYDGLYYGDWSVFGKDVLANDKGLQARLVPFEQDKAITPKTASTPKDIDDSLARCLDMIDRLASEIETIHDTHIFAADDEHNEAECGYCGIVEEARSLLKEVHDERE